MAESPLQLIEPLIRHRNGQPGVRSEFIPAAEDFRLCRDRNLILRLWLEDIALVIVEPLGKAAAFRPREVQ